MSLLKLPIKYDSFIDAQKKWLNILQLAQDTVETDYLQQRQTAKGMRLQVRSLPPEVAGRNYARYCDLVNKMYDAYLNSVHLQRAPYILEIITVIMKRLYELRNELVHIIVNDYIYVDAALQQLHMTPLEIEIVVPYHFPLEARSESVEKILQQMWTQALRRKKKRERPKISKPPPRLQKGIDLDSDHEAVEEEEDEIETPPASVHTVIPEEYIQSLTIQRHERFRQWNMSDIRAKALERKQYFLQTNEPAPIDLRIKAAILIQSVYREIMKIKRQRFTDHKRDILLGVVPDPFRKRLSFFEENNKMYARRENTRSMIKKTYLEELEKQKTRLLLLRKNDIIDDITDEIREWLSEWFYGYNFFPQYPYPLEGGTLVVVRGDYPTVEEQFEEDDRIFKLTKGRTKEQLKAERKQARREAKLEAETRKITEMREKEALVMLRCDPFSDPGYRLQMSDEVENLIEVIRKYRQTWSVYDTFPPEFFGETVYGYMKPLLVEDVMKEIHADCRLYVDELMRIDLKMLTEIHQLEYKLLKWEYPKLKPRKKPRPTPKHKILAPNVKLLKNSEDVFDLGIVTKSTTKFTDIFGDSNYAAYDYNVKDPDASFPPPGYGDIKGRLMLSCVLGCGIQPGATRRKAVLLLGPDRNGKSFLADAVAGELNAIKIDITPEVFTAVCQKPEKVLTQVFLVARAFQPAVIFMKNIERVFIKRVPPEQVHLKATIMQDILGKLVKSIQNEDKVIFIATSSNPWIARHHLMMPMFDEVLLVPRTDYGSLQQFFYNKFLSIRSMPQDYPIQPIAQLTQGYGFADIIDVYNEVMTPERIVRLNVQELSPAEFIQVLVEKQVEYLTLEDYQKYVDFFLANSDLKKEREEYAIINEVRESVYKKGGKKMKALIARE